MIKVSTLHSVLHEKDRLTESSRHFLASVEEQLGEPLEISPLADYDCELKLIFIETGGSEMLFKNAMDTLHEPFYFLTSGENNSLAATLEILTYLNAHGLKGEILHGTPGYIAGRIQVLQRKTKVRPLEGKRYGIIGTPSDWLIASIPDYREAEEKLGCRLIDIGLDELKNGFKDARPENFVTAGFDRNEVELAERVHLALDRIVEKYALDGFTLRCFDLLDTLHTTGCLSLAHFNARGIIGTCEGDVMAMLSMALVREATGLSSFQANPSRIDTESREILFAHCTVPFDMPESYRYKTHFESGIGAAVKGELRTGPVTVFRLGANLNDSFIGLGEITENKDLENLCRTQVVVRMADDVSILLQKPAGNHHIICYGDHAEALRNLLK